MKNESTRATATPDFCPGCDVPFCPCQPSPSTGGEPVAWRRATKHSWEYRNTAPTASTPGTGWMPLVEPATDSAGRIVWADFDVMLRNFLCSATREKREESRTALLATIQAMIEVGVADAAREPAPVARELPLLREVEELFGQYWDIAYAEGATGNSNGYVAGTVLSELRALFASPTTAERAPASAAPDEQPEPSPLYFQALDLVHEAGFASVSMVQRRLRIGWNAARNLIELMVDRSEIPDAWLPPAAVLSRRAPSPVGAKESDQ